MPESFFCSYVLRNHRFSRLQSKPCCRASMSWDGRVSDYARPPVDARSHEEVMAVRKKLKHLYEIDLDSLGDELGRPLKEMTDVVAPKRLAAKSGQGGNLLAQLISRMFHVISSSDARPCSEAPTDKSSGGGVETWAALS